jgi:uncharacterized protein
MDIKENRTSALIFFVKAPEEGAVKTRLAAEIGRSRALEIYKGVAAQSLKAVRGGAYELRVAFHPPDAGEQVAGWLGGGFIVVPQTGGGLGERMENSFAQGFSEGMDRILLTGSDIPGLDNTVAEDAFAALEDHDAVIVPTFDGGYCLIGFTAEGYTPAVFRGIKWSTGTVCAETLAVLAGEGKSVMTLPTLRDIDNVSDLKYLPPSRKFSVIIPVLHESENINKLIKRLRGMEGSEDCEVIVVDGSPDADTLAVIEDGGLLGILSGKGRARQMNAGAAAAMGEVLIFLHADTVLPDGALSKVTEVMKSGRYVGGAFGLLIDSRQPFIKFISWSAGLRSRFTRIPYGDQAIFIGRDYFHSIGGYKDIPLMEDVELMGRIRKLGGKIRILDEPAITSARKYHEDGPVYSAFRNHALRILYSLGVPPDKLVKLYYRD